MSRQQAANDTVNGVFNLNSLLEDLPQHGSASAPTTPFPDAITTKPQIGRALHAPHASMSAAPFGAYGVGGAVSQSPAIGSGSPAIGQRGGAANVYDYGAEHRSAYRMPRTINVSVFNGQIRRGVCKFFNSQKGFGFINDAKPDDLDHVEVFVHFTAIASNGGFRSLAENEECEYTLVPGPKGYQASNVTGPGGRPVMGDPKARAPVPKHPPHYMFMPPHGPAFYDPYHGHPQAPYYPHSPYQQVMLSIVPSNHPGSPYGQVAHPGAPYTPANGSPYAIHHGASLPPSPPSTAGGQPYLYSNGMPTGVNGTPATRASPFMSSSPYGLGLGALGNGAVGKTPWQPPASVSGLGGHRVSAAEASGRYGSPSIGHSGADASPLIASTPSDFFSTNANGGSGSGNKHIKPPATAPMTSGAFEPQPSAARRGSSAQELFEAAAASKPAQHKHQLSTSSGLLYQSSNAGSA